MFMLKKNILINGCGITFGSSSIKSWPKVLSLLGSPVINLSAPAISNQWIVDRTSEYLLKNNDVGQVIIQLTNLNKLDVEIKNNKREQDLVVRDSLRNFTWHGVWPSSCSQEHLSKKLYNEYLYSPELLSKELAIKIVMMNFWCQKHGIKLHVYQGYAIPWTASDLELVGNIIKNIDSPWDQEYKKSSTYQNHDHTNSNSVPCTEYAFILAEQIAKALNLDYKKINELSTLYVQKQKS